MIDASLQCSVCWEDFKLDEPVRKLVCDHFYHTDCIVPWLQLHGTCPICRKSLNDETNSVRNRLKLDFHTSLGPFSSNYFDYAREIRITAVTGLRPDQARARRTAAIPAAAANHGWPVPRSLDLDSFRPLSGTIISIWS